MSVAACAALVERGDPDRFLAAMSAPVAAREVLFPLYAFQLEVARAPWVTAEAMIAEMRLQWWRDVVAELADGKPPRAHEVVEPLAPLVTPETAPWLDQMIALRRWDIYKDPFEDEAHFRSYITATAGAVMKTARVALGGTPDVDGVAYAVGLMRFFRAVPELEARGRVPLLDGRPDAVRELAREALGGLRFSKPRAPLLEAWEAGAVLQRVVEDPMAVVEGRLELSPFRRHWRLLRASSGLL